MGGAKNLSEQQRLTRARFALMAHKKWSLYAGVMMMGELRVETTAPHGEPTAATNGRDVTFDPRFIAGLTDAGLRFVLMHETEHKALRQITTYHSLTGLTGTGLSPDRLQYLANAAMDYVVNIRLVDGDAGEGFMAMPSGCLIDTRYRGWGTREVFDDLVRREQDEGQTGAEEHKKTMDYHDLEAALSLPAEERRQLHTQIESALRQGRLTGGAQQTIEDIVAPAVDWRRELAEFLVLATRGREEASWGRMNRRAIAQGIWLPGTIAAATRPILVAADSSGSVTREMLGAFVAQVEAIARDVRPEAVDVIWWDTKVQAHQRFTVYESMTDHLRHVPGGGGTDPSCVPAWIQSRHPRPDYAAAVVLTDGETGGRWGVWGDLPVLWGITQRGITATTGKTVYVGG